MDKENGFVSVIKDEREGVTERFDSTKVSEGLPFKKIGAIEPLRFPKKTAVDNTTFSEGFLSTNLVLSNRCVFRT